MNPWFVDALGYAAALLTLGTYSMRTMIPLRALGICANCCFIAYGSLAGVYPNLILHLVLLPLNIFRLREMLALVREVGEAAKGDLTVDWLKPYMTAREYSAGERVLSRGDIAQGMYFVGSGRFAVPELGVEIGPGELVGELGFIAPENRRTQSLECVQSGRLFQISYDHLRQLYFQNPKFGFYFLQLASRRLFHDIDRVENLQATG
jgi:hypothetical protein